MRIGFSANNPWWIYSMDETCILRQVHTPKVGFYIVYFFLLFLNKSQKGPTFGCYNLDHSDVTVFHSFKPKVEKTFMNSNK